MTDLQDRVDALASDLGCAVLVEDARHRPLWWSAQGEVDSVRMRSILQREAPPAAAAVVTRLGLPTAEGPVRTPAVPEVDMAQRWCVPIRDGGRLLGYLWVLDAQGQVSPSDLDPVVACARAAGTVMARLEPSAADRDKRRTLLLARLAGARDADAARELIDLDDLSPAATVAVDAQSGRGGRLLPDGSRAYLDPSARAVFASGRPVPLLDLSVAVHRAAVTRRAVGAGARLTRPSWDALGAWHLVVAAPADLTPGRIHPGADVLLAQKRPDLLITARCVLDNGGDVTASADELHVHRTTLYYRLDRIEALTGVNLRLADGRDDLHLALQLAAYRAAE